MSTQPFHLDLPHTETVAHEVGPALAVAIHMPEHQELEITRVRNVSRLAGTLLGPPPPEAGTEEQLVVFAVHWGLKRPVARGRDT